MADRDQFESRERTGEEERVELPSEMVQDLDPSGSDEDIVGGGQVPYYKKGTYSSAD